MKRMCQFGPSLRSLAGLVRVDGALASTVQEAGWTVTKLGALKGVTPMWWTQSSWG